jgi:hypothetical protein
MALIAHARHAKKEVISDTVHENDLVRREDMSGEPMTSDQGLDFFGEHHILANFPLNRQDIKTGRSKVCLFVALWLLFQIDYIGSRDLVRMLIPDWYCRYCRTAYLSCSFHLRPSLIPSCLRL